MIAVCDYGIGNLASAEKALLAVGAPARLVRRPEEAAQASGIVLPGVGSFAACAKALRNSGFDELCRAAVLEERPLLGICVGMQLLFEASEESPGTAGLGLLGGVVRRLPPGRRRPQMQWNLVTPTRPNGLLATPEWFYFVHSYYAVPERDDDVLARADYGVCLPAVVGRGRLLATQVHPEKSGPAGLGLLARFAESCAAT